MMRTGFSKTAVLTGLCCCLCLFFILGITENAILSAVLCFTCFAVLFGMSLRTCGKSSAVFLAVCTAVCCIHGLISYNIGEKNAKLLMHNSNNATEHVYTATVVSCNNYSSYSSADVKITKIDEKDTSENFKCRLGFYSGESLMPGDTLTFSGTPQAPSNNEDDTFDNISYLRSRKIFITFPSAKIISVNASDKPLPLTLKVRQHMERIIYKYVPDNFRFDTADISYAMLLGDKTVLTSKIKEDFTRSGIIHLLCVSGMHLSVIMGSLFAFLRIFNIRKSIKYTILITFCLLYLTLIGFPVSALRAGLICLLGYGAALSGRNTDSYSSLFYALIIICAISPYSVLDISAQLSFFSSLGIITLTDLFCNKITKNSSTAKKLLFSLQSMLIANTGAVLFTFLISSYSFGAVSIVSIITTMLTSFVCSILLISLVLLIILSPLSFLSPILEFIGNICNVCAKYIQCIAEFFSDMKFSYTETLNVGPYLTAFLILTFLICIFIYFDFRLFRVCTVLGISLICVIVIFSSLISAIYKDSLYTVSYFRQNENDRQLSVKTGHEGYLIINADNTLCTNSKKAVFDSKSGYNYLLIIPDKLIHPSVLASNIKSFDELYGIRKVFVPSTDSGKELAVLLAEKGCETYLLDNTLNFGTMTMSFNFTENSSYMEIDDGKVKTAILFSDSYNSEHFSSDCDIAAFFTRKTANRFDVEKDILPSCDVFVTRLKKDENHPKIYNTNGLKSHYVKE